MKCWISFEKKKAEVYACRVSTFDTGCNLCTVRLPNWAPYVLKPNIFIVAFITSWLKPEDATNDVAVMFKWNSFWKEDEWMFPSKVLCDVIYPAQRCHWVLLKKWDNGAIYRHIAQPFLQNKQRNKFHMKRHPAALNKHAGNQSVQLCW